MKRILVTGAGGSAASNYIQSLRHNPKKEKFYIVGVDKKKYHIELANVDKRYLLPGIDDPSYISKLNKIIATEKIDLVHPQPDVEVDFLARHTKDVKAKMLLPKPETIDLCQNKMQLTDLLKKNNLNVPEAYYLESEKDLKKALKKLLKTNEKVWLRAIRGAGSRAALPVKNVDHAKMWVDYWRIMKGLNYGDFMVSEFLPGAEYAFQSFWIDGKIIMSQTRERVEYIFGNLTPSGQSSSPSVAVTVHNDAVNKLAHDAIKLADKKATGIFCADIKTNKNGEVCLIEINAGRFFTTSNFFSEAGLNVPYYYTKYALGEPVKHNLKPYNNIPAGWYWVRMIDMGYKLIKPNEWSAIPA